MYVSYLKFCLRLLGRTLCAAIDHWRAALLRPTNWEMFRTSTVAGCISATKWCGMPLLRSFLGHGALSVRTVGT